MLKSLHCLLVHNPPIVQIPAAPGYEDALLPGMVVPEGLNSVDPGLMKILIQG